MASNHIFVQICMKIGLLVQMLLHTNTDMTIGKTKMKIVIFCFYSVTYDWSLIHMWIS